MSQPVKRVVLCLPPVACEKQGVFSPLLIFTDDIVKSLGICMGVGSISPVDAKVSFIKWLSSFYLSIPSSPPRTLNLKIVCHVQCMGYSW